LNDDIAASLGRTAAGAAASIAPYPDPGHGRNRFCNHRDRRRRRRRKRRRRRRRRRRRNTGSGEGLKLIKVVPQLLDVAGALGRVGWGQRQDGGEQVHGRGWEDGGRREIGRRREERAAQILEGGGGGFHSLGRHHGVRRRFVGRSGLLSGGRTKAVSGCEKLCCA
jgi:hypothetical protein